MKPSLYFPGPACLEKASDGLEDKKKKKMQMVKWQEQTELISHLFID